MTIKTHHPDDFAIELFAITKLSRSVLIERWETHHGKEPPKGVSRRLLEYSAAYQLQAKAFGGLSPTVRRKLMRLAPTTKRATKSNKPVHPSKQLSTGTRLVRESHGEIHTIEVQKEGYAYYGELYGSLSVIAKLIARGISFVSVTQQFNTANSMGRLTLNVLLSSNARSRPSAFATRLRSRRGKGYGWAACRRWVTTTSTSSW